ncbi:MAG: NERD domain-containing protein [Anaerolineales bacterium]|nr:NERD domain-containing protein [Anaerolineales bacterium]
MPYYRKAGKSTREMASRRRRTTNIFLFIMLGLAMILALTVQNWRKLGLSGGLVFALLILLRILPDMIEKPLRKWEKAERRADRGAVAEEVIGDLLATLNDDYFVLNDVSSPYGNIDHIVIAKHGVFLLETKAHGGRVEILSDRLLVNGKNPEKNFIAQALRNTYWLREEIERITGQKIWITPLIVFTNAFVEINRPIKGVIVTNKKFLISILHRQTRHHSGMTKVWEMKERIAQELEGGSSRSWSNNSTAE